MAWVRESRGKRSGARRGVVVVLAIFLVIVLFAMAAFAVDVGHLMLVRTQLQLAADSGARAAGNSLDRTAAEIKQIGFDVVAMHTAGGPLVCDSDAVVELGNWDVASQQFTPTAGVGNAVRVTAHRRQADFFFAKLLGERAFEVRASAIAVADVPGIVIVARLSRTLSGGGPMFVRKPIGRRPFHRWDRQARVTALTGRIA